MGAGSRDGREQLDEDVVDREALGHCPVRQREARVEDVVRDVVDVLRHRALASAQERHGPGAADQPQRGSRAGAVLEQTDQLRQVVRHRVARREHQADGVVERCLVHRDAVGRHPGAQPRRARRAGGPPAAAHRPCGRRSLVPRPVSGSRPGPHQEAIALRLGERIDALRLDGVLRGHDQERPRHRKGATSDGDLSLRHRLQQGRLDPGGGAVDLVDEDDVGQDRPRLDVEGLGRGPEDPGPDDVGRDQVRCELDAVEGATEDPCEGRQQQRLAEARRALEEDVPVRQHGDEEPIDDPILADDDLAQLVTDLGQAGGGEFVAHGHAPWPSLLTFGGERVGRPVGAQPLEQLLQELQHQAVDRVGRSGRPNPPARAGDPASSPVPAAAPAHRGPARP